MQTPNISLQRYRGKKGFTLLEIIVVIIILGVLATLALPRFFGMVEFSRSAEALTATQGVRSSVERCFLQTGDYQQCLTFADLDIDDPADATGNHFTYTITTIANGFTVTATRNALDGGTVGDTVFVTQNNAADTVTRGGTGAFSGIQ